MRVTFKPIVRRHQQRKDKTFPVIIRIGWQSKYVFMPTKFSVDKTGLTRTLGIKSSEILDECNVLIKKYRKITEQIEDINTLDVSEIADIVSAKLKMADGIDFFWFFEEQLRKMAEDNFRSRHLYQTTYNHLRKIDSRLNLDSSLITPKYLQEFDNKLIENGVGDRGRNIYLGRVRAIYNQMIDEYEHLGYTFAYPFRKYKLPRVKPPKTVALTKEELLNIVNIDLSKHPRASKARYIFIVSLLTLGTNAVDLFSLETSKNGRIEYNRSKTKSRRDDNAFISIKIEPELNDIIGKIRGEHPYLLCFNQWYANTIQLNKAVRAGLRKVAELLDMEYFVFYDARRTVASIMRNKLGISKDDIAMCLNHVDMSHKITDYYIETDFSILDRCNRKFLDYLFDKGEYAPK